MVLGITDGEMRFLLRSKRHGKLLANLECTPGIDSPLFYKSLNGTKQASSPLLQLN